MTAMLNYASTGEIPQFEGNERFIWPTIQEQIDRDMSSYQEKCAKNRSNGAKGGRPPKNQMVNTETEWFFEEPKKAKEKENEKENKKEIESTQDACTQSIVGFNSPTEEQIRLFCTEENLSKTDPRRFFNYYSANGWKMGNTPMVDWRAAARLWNDRELEKHPLAEKKKPTLSDMFPPVPTL